MASGMSAMRAGSRAPSTSLRTAARSLAPIAAHHVYPTAGTVFQDTRTPLQVWFYAIYLFVTTRHGVSGKELQRALGVTYKTAWRMGQQIRILMAKADGFEKCKATSKLTKLTSAATAPCGKPGRGDNKTIVLGMVERGGRTVAKSVPNLRIGYRSPVHL